MWITSGSIADIAIIWAKVEDEDNQVRGFLSRPIDPASAPTISTASGLCAPP